MKFADLRNLLIVAMIVVAALTYGAFRFERHRAWEADYTATQDAFGGAWEYRDAGSLLFAPRWKDFETADDKLRGLEHVSARDVAAAGVLHECGEMLRTYRRSVESAAATDDAAAFVNVQLGIGREVAQCLLR